MSNFCLNDKIRYVRDLEEHKSSLGFFKEDVKKATKEIKKELMEINHHSYTWAERDCRVNMIIDKILWGIN